MTLVRIQDVEPLRQLAETLCASEQAFLGLTRSELVSAKPAYQGYCVILHEIYLDRDCPNSQLTWDDTGFGTQLPTNTRRVRWQELAREKGVQFDPSTPEDLLERLFGSGSWPRQIIGPEEGTASPEILSVVSAVLGSRGERAECFFHFDNLATSGYSGERLYTGFIDEARSTRDLDGIEGGPTHWWPVSREWCFHTDWDSPYSVFAGSESLCNELKNQQELEVIGAGSDLTLGGG